MAFTLEIVGSGKATPIAPLTVFRTLTGLGVLLFSTLCNQTALSFSGTPDERGRVCSIQADGRLDRARGMASCTEIIRNVGNETASSRYTAYLNRSVLHDFFAFNTRRGLADADAAIAIDPRRIEGHIARGWFLIGLNENEAALRSLNRALQIDPRSVAAKFERSRAYQNLGRLDLAISDMRSVVEINPRGWYYFGRLGLLLERNGELAAARDALKVAIPHYPRVAEFSAALQRIEVALARQQPAAVVSGRHPSSLRPFYPPDVYRARPEDASDDCMVSLHTENCFRQIYQRHAVVDAEQASRGAKMVIVISRDRQPRAPESIGIGIHPAFAQSAQVLACNNLEPYDPAEARACQRGQATWRGQLSPNRSGRLEIVVCPDGGYFALYGARQDPHGYAWGVICGAPSIEAAKRGAENSCQARAAAAGIQPTRQPGPQGQGCLLAIAGFNDGIDYRHTLPRRNHQNFMCFGRERQRHASVMSFQHTNTPNSVRVDAACTNQISPVGQ